MGVIRRVRLNILSKEDIQELENNIIKLESLAKRKEAAKAKMQEVRARRGKTVGPSGTIFSGTDDEALPRDITRKRAQGDLDRSAHSKASNSAKAKDTKSAQAILKTPPFKRLLSRTDKLEMGLDETKADLLKINHAISDPISFIQNMVGSSKFAVRLFKVAAVVTILHAMITGIAKQMFGPGGIFDIRKLFRDETATIIQLQHLIDIEQGRTFYSTDMRAFSHIVQNSSTENLGSYDQLYKEINVGSDIL
jgi:hypothetical protein